MISFIFLYGSLLSPGCSSLRPSPRPCPRFTFLHSGAPCARWLQAPSWGCYAWITSRFNIHTISGQFRWDVQVHHTQSEARFLATPFNLHLPPKAAAYLQTDMSFLLNSLSVWHLWLLKTTNVEFTLIPYFSHFHSYFVRSDRVLLCLLPEYLIHQSPLFL